ncbi:MAG: two-component sensor histidine kinase [Variovorax paradoxus]|uniref:histidine kinase n=1 Tax=Variovorax paradoxus TaxID=34073 RepID=A0A2W5QJB9_VARPD|nr:MAG: two-component sensor histidine kinase [Variovorax paradoxus]
MKAPALHLGPPRTFSIWRRLLWWLVPTFLAVAVVTAGLSYGMFTHMVADFLDGQMVQLGDSVARYGQPTAPSAQVDGGAIARGDYVIQVFEPDGRLAATTWSGLPAGQPLRPGLHDVRAGGRAWRVYAAAGAGGRTVQVFQSSDFRSGLAVERAGMAAVPVLVLVPLLMLVMLGVARGISRSLRAIGQQAARQDAHSIEELPLAHVPDEIRPLVASFNDLLARLRDSFVAQRRFVQDAAHELRTPIAAVRVQLENLRDELAGSAGNRQLAQLEAGLQRAQRLVDQLLRMSRQESAATEPAGAVDVEAQVRDSIHGLLALADRRQVDLGLVAQDGAVPTLHCTAADLRSALDNLIENAVRYTPRCPPWSGGRVRRGRGRGHGAGHSAGAPVPGLRPLLPRAGKPGGRQRAGVADREGGGTAVRPAPEPEQPR